MPSSTASRAYCGNLKAKEGIYSTGDDKFDVRYSGAHQEQFQKIYKGANKRVRRRNLLRAEREARGEVLT